MCLTPEMFLQLVTAWDQRERLAIYLERLLFHDILGEEHEPSCIFHERYLQRIVGRLKYRLAMRQAGYLGIRYPVEIVSGTHTSR